MKYLFLLLIIGSGLYLLNTKKHNEQKSLIDLPVILDVHQVQKVSFEELPKTPKKKSFKKTKIGKSQSEITQETEKEFLAMIIPESLSNIKEERYQQVYKVYQQTAFYLSEVAANNLPPNKNNLVKAFRGLVIYYNEIKSIQNQEDDALAIIQAERPAIFDEALEELSKPDQSLIKQILKIQLSEE